VTIAARSEIKLKAAAEKLGDSVETEVLNTNDNVAIERFLRAGRAVGPHCHLRLADEERTGAGT